MTFGPRLRRLPHDDLVIEIGEFLDRLGGVQRQANQSVGVPVSGGAVCVSTLDVRLEFPARSAFLTANIVIDGGGVVLRYSFDLRKEPNVLIRRWDFHEGHELEHGGPFHIHEGPSETNRVASTDLTLDELHRAITEAVDGLPST